MPTTAPGTLIISGHIAALTTDASVPGAALEARLRAGDAIAGTATADGSGNFVLAVSTGGVPFDGYLVLTQAGYVGTRLYVSKPVASNVQLGTVFLASPVAMSMIYTLQGLSRDLTKATILASARDCILAPIGDADFVFTQGGTPVSGTIAELPVPGVTFTMALNVPPGVTQVGAFFEGITLSTAHATTLAGQLTMVTILP